MGFRFRLLLFLAVVLTAIYGLTGILAYEATWAELVAQGERQLTTSSQAFIRQLRDISERVADNVRVMAMDYGLRAAIAQKDRETVLSALRNHGHRVRAARMMLVGLDGTIEADTGRDAKAAAPSGFPFADLLDKALEEPSSTVIRTGDMAYWLVVVPVLAPTPIGFVAATIPIDEALLARLQESATLPEPAELIAPDKDGNWFVLPSTRRSVSVASGLLATGHAPLSMPVIVGVGGRDYVALTADLTVADRDDALRGAGGSAIRAVFGYSIDAALRPYRRIFVLGLFLFAGGLLAILAGAVVVARGVSRPLEQLARTAMGIAEGEYGVFTSPSISNDEVGKLGKAFGRMIEAVREREGKLLHQARHDALTGLPNLSVIAEAMEADLVRDREAAGTLVTLRLDGLPEIIKTLGHAVADRIIMASVERLRRFLLDEGGGDPDGAMPLLARTGEAVFSLWLPGAAPDDALGIAQRLVGALSAPHREVDLTVDLVPVAGIASAPAHGRVPSLLLQRGEVALHLAQKGSAPVAVYAGALDPHRPERLSLMAELRTGLEQGEFRLHYQPKLNLASGRIEGAEALVRWFHPKRGMIPPDDFISLAEHTGNIRFLTRWVLETGIRQLAGWRAEGMPVRLAVNLSARDLEEEDLPALIGALLDRHGVGPEQLVLEITESAMMRDPDSALPVLKALASRGIDLAIDDFGVGQSSFAYLRRLPVRELKIDKSFVIPLSESVGDRIIVHSIVEIGHRLGFRVTAEGVEDAAALAFLREVNCDYVQGYYLARPLAGTAFAEFLAKWSG